MSEEALLTRSSKAKKPMNACVHTYTKSQTPSTRRRGPGWRIHGSVEDTKLSTNKQHTLSGTRWCNCLDCHEFSSPPFLCFRPHPRMPMQLSFRPRPRNAAAGARALCAPHSQQLPTTWKPCRNSLSSFAISLHTILRHIHAIPGLYIPFSSPHIESHMVHAKTRTDILATNTN